MIKDTGVTMIKVALRLLGALACGIFISVWILQHNLHVQSFLSETIIKSLENEWQVDISPEEFAINLFTCSLYCKNGTIKPRDDKKFSWNFEECKIQVSPGMLLFKKLFLTITLNNIRVCSDLSLDGCAILDHVYMMLSSSSSDFKIRPRMIKINNLELALTTPQGPCDIATLGTFVIKKDREIKNKDRAWTGKVSLIAAHARLNDVEIIKEASGLTSFFYDKSVARWSGQINCGLSSPILDLANGYALQGSWSGDKISIALSDAKKITDLHAGIQPNEVSITGTLAVQDGMQAFSIFLLNQQTPLQLCNLSGRCAIESSMTWTNNALVAACNLDFKGLSIGGIALSGGNASLRCADGKSIEGSVTITPTADMSLTGSYVWDLPSKTGSINLVNKGSMKIPGFGSVPALRSNLIINDGDFVSSCTINKIGRIQGEYRCMLSDDNGDEYTTISGNYMTGKKYAYLSGLHTGDGSFVVRLAHDPAYYIDRFIVVRNNKRQINLQATEEDRRLQGTVQYSFLQTLLSETMQHSVFGTHCVFGVSLDQDRFDQVRGSVQLKRGRFYLPENRNLIDSLSSSFLVKVSEKNIEISDFAMGCGNGFLRCPRGVIALNDNYEISLMHAPLQVDNLFVNWKRDFYGLIYGNCLLNKLPDTELRLTGNLTLKRSLLRDSIFTRHSLSSTGPLSLLSNGAQGFGIDVVVVTEKPIKVATEALETFAHLDIRFLYACSKEVIQMPRVTGTVNLEGGHLKFLRNRLLIDYGKIEFLTNQMNDPLIDLVAKNRINKYQITLQATGSLEKPTVMLESSPELTEEQIFGLLLAGSEHTTLQADLPAMLMQNLNHIFLGRKKHLPRASSIFEKLTRPLRYVQIAPNFTDQSARGGIKGIFSVDLNEQLHAQIQKNFNLQEDFSFYLQYLLSDDVNVKVVKDQRGEIGSEVEVRLKL